MYHGYALHPPAWASDCKNSTSQVSLLGFTVFES